MLNINLFGGPGTGKSTTATSLFAKLKKRGFRAEYVSEFAKDLTYAGDKVKLSDQLLVVAEQHHRLFRLRNNIIDNGLEYVVHDSPFIIGLAYLKEDSLISKELYNAMIVDLFNKYDNLNIFVERDVDYHAYQQYGRNQELAESMEIDLMLKKLLDDNNIPYHTIKISASIEEDIMGLIMKKSMPSGTLEDLVGEDIHEILDAGECETVNVGETHEILGADILKAASEGKDEPVEEKTNIKGAIRTWCTKIPKVINIKKRFGMPK